MASEIEIIAQYLREAMAAFDPTVSTAEGGAFDKQVVQPLVQKMTPDPLSTKTKEFLETRLTQAWGDGTVGEGTVLHDLLVKNQTLILDPYKRDQTQIKLRQSLANSDLLTAEEVGELTDNMFIVRSEGKRTIGPVRIYYENPRADYITPSVECSTNTGLRYFPIGTFSITAQDMIVNFEDGLYFWDITVLAEFPGDEYDIEPGMLKNIRGQEGVHSITNKQRYKGGIPADTKADLLRKAESGNAEGSLNTGKGIQKTLYRLFPDLRAILAIGYRDVEMERDILKGALTGTALFSGTGLIFGDIFIGFDTWKFQDADGNTYVHQEGDFLEIYYSPTMFDLPPGTEEYDTFEIEKVYVNAGDLSFLADNIVVAKLDHRAEVDGSKILPVSFLIPAPYVWKRNMQRITLSDIPGGIKNPTTDYGTITVAENEIHIGGHTDIYLRGLNEEEKELRVQDIPTIEFIALGDGDTVTLEAVDPTMHPEVPLHETNRLHCVGRRLYEFGVRVGYQLWINSGENLGLFTVVGIEDIDDPVEVNESYLWVDRALAPDNPTAFKIFKDVVVDLRNIERFVLPYDGENIAGLSTDAGSNIVTLNENAGSFGVVAGDILQINEGPDTGEYSVLGVIIDNSPESNRKLRISRGMSAGRFNLEYRIVRREEGVEFPVITFHDLGILNSSQQKTGIDAVYGLPVDGRNQKAFSGATEASVGKYGLVMPDFASWFDMIEPPEGITNLDLEEVARIAREGGETIFEEILADYGYAGFDYTVQQLFEPEYLTYPPPYPNNPATGDPFKYPGQETDAASEKYPFGTTLRHTRLQALALLQCYDPTSDGYVFPVMVLDTFPPEHGQAKIVEVCIPKAFFDGKNNLFLGLPNISLGEIARWLESTERQNRGSLTLSVDTEAEEVVTPELYPPGRYDYAYRKPELTPSPIFDAKKGDILKIGDGKAKGSYLIKDTYPIELNFGGVFENWSTPQGAMPKWWPYVTGQTWPPVWYTPKDYPDGSSGTTDQYPEYAPHYWGSIIAFHAANWIYQNTEGNPAFPNPFTAADVLHWVKGFGIPTTPPYWWNDFGRITAANSDYIEWVVGVGPFLNGVAPPYWWPETDVIISCRFPTPQELYDDPALWPVLGQYPPEWFDSGPDPTAKDGSFTIPDEFLEKYLTGEEAIPGLDEFINFLGIPFVSPKTSLVGTTIKKMLGIHNAADWPPRFEPPVTKPIWYPSEDDWSAFANLKYPVGSPPSWWKEHLDGEWPGWVEAYGEYIPWQNTETGRYIFLEDYWGPDREARRDVRLQAGLAELECVFPGDPPGYGIPTLLESIAEGEFLEQLRPMFEKLLGEDMTDLLFEYAQKISDAYVEGKDLLAGVAPAGIGLILNALSVALNANNGKMPGFVILIYNLFSMFSVAGTDIIAGAFTSGTMLSDPLFDLGYDYGEDGDGSPEGSGGYLTATGAAIFNDSWELVKKIAGNVFTPYEVATPAKGAVRLFFNDPVSFTASSWCSNPTTFVAEHEDGELLFTTDPLHRYTLVPGQAASGEPNYTELPRELQIVEPWEGKVNFCSVDIPVPVLLELDTDHDKLEINEEWSPYGRLYSWLSYIGARWHKLTIDDGNEKWTTTYRMEVSAKMPEMNNISPVGVKTSTLSNVIQFPSVKAQPVHTGIEASVLSELVGDINIRPPMVDLTEGNVGDIVAVGDGEDEGLYKIIRWVDPFSVELDKSLAITTQKVLKAFATYFLYAEEGELWEYGENKNPEGNYLFAYPIAYDAESEDELLFPLTEEDAGRWVTLYGSSIADCDGTYQIMAVYDAPAFRATDVAIPGVYARLDRAESFPDTSAQFAYVDIITGNEYTGPMPPGEEIAPTVRLKCGMGCAAMHYNTGGATGKGEYQAVRPVRIYNGDPALYDITGWDKTLDPDEATLHIRSKNREIGTRVWQGEQQPFKLIREGIQRKTAGMMELQREGGLYYMDVDVISLQGGGASNLVANTRIEPILGTYQSDGYRIDVDDPNYTFSVDEEPKLRLPARVLPKASQDYPIFQVPLFGGNLAIGYTRSVDTQQVQSVISSDSERITNANQLARHFLPSYVSLNVTYAGDVEHSVLYQKVSELMQGLYGSDTLALSEIERVLYKLGVSVIDRDLWLYTLTHDLRRRLVGDRTNKIMGGMNEVAFKGSGRTTYFIPGSNKSIETDLSPGPGISFTRVASSRLTQ